MDLPIRNGVEFLRLERNRKIKHKGTNTNTKTMFSFQKLDHPTSSSSLSQSSNDGSTADYHGVLRGSPLVSYLSKHSSQHNHLKIRSIQSTAGHFAVQFNDLKTCFIMDHVPSSILSNKSNETLSLHLLNNTLLHFSSLSSTSASNTLTTTTTNTATTHTQSEQQTQQQSHNNNSVFGNLGKLIPQKNKTNNYSVQSLSSSPPSASVAAAAHGGEISNFEIFSSSNANSSNSILCFGDLSCPLVSVFFHLEKFSSSPLATSSPSSPNNNNNNNNTSATSQQQKTQQHQKILQNEILYLFAVQQNGTVWIWHFDSILYTWKLWKRLNLFSCVSSLSSSLSSTTMTKNVNGGETRQQLQQQRILNMTFVPSMGALVWTQYDSYLESHDSNQEPDNEMESEKSEKFLLESKNGKRVTVSVKCAFIMDHHSHININNNNNSNYGTVQSDIVKSENVKSFTIFTWNSLTILQNHFSFQFMHKNINNTSNNGNNGNNGSSEQAQQQQQNDILVQNRNHDPMSHLIFDIQPSKSSPSSSSSSASQHHGFWLFTCDGIFHISISRQSSTTTSSLNDRERVNGDSDNLSVQVCSVPGGGVHVRHFIQFMSQLESLKLPSTWTSGGSGSGSGGGDIVAVSENNVENVQNRYYVTHCVHPTSKELVLLDLNGEVSIVAPVYRMNRTSLSVRRLKQPITHFSIDEKLNLYKKLIVHYDQAKRSPATTPNTILTLRKQGAHCKQGTFIELFFVHNTILGVTDQETMIMYEPKTCTKLGQVPLPNEIALDDKLYMVAGKKSIVWQVCGPSARPGLFSSTGLYYVKCPPMADLLKQAVEQLPSMTASSRSSMIGSSGGGGGSSGGGRSDASGYNISDQDLYHIAMRAKQWGLDSWYIQYMLDLLIIDAEQMQKRKFANVSSSSLKRDTSSDQFSTSESSSHLLNFEVNINTKKQLLLELSEKLENPALVWTATKSLAEQKHLLKSVAQFLMHFPCPDSSFWKTEKQAHLSQALQQKFKELNKSSSVMHREKLSAETQQQHQQPQRSQWDQLLTEICGMERSQVSTMEVFNRMTPLNFSVVPTLAKSLSLSKEQIDSFSENLPSFSKLNNHGDSDSDGSNNYHSSTARITITEKPIDVQMIKTLSAIELEDLSRQRPLPVLRALCEVCGLQSFLPYIDHGAQPSHDEVKFSPASASTSSSQSPHSPSSPLTPSVSRSGGSNGKHEPNTVLGYTIPDHSTLNKILLDNFELSHDELLAQFDPSCMSRPLTQLESVSPDLAFHRDDAGAQLMRSSSHATHFSSFNVSCGCTYFEILCRLLFESTQHAPLITVLITMIYRAHMDQMHQELQQLESQLNRMVTQPNKTLAEQVRKHLIDLQRQKINHLKKFMATRDYVLNSSESIFKTFYCSRALEVLNSVCYSSNMIRYDSIKHSSCCGSDMSSSMHLSHTKEQVLTLCQLLLWNGQILPAIQLLLPKQLDDYVINILSLYVVTPSSVRPSSTRSAMVGAGAGGDDSSSNNRLEIDYQSIRLSHERQCELVHILTDYCIRQHNEKRNSELWSIVWQLIPMSYNPFEFIKQFEQVNVNGMNRPEQKDTETNQSRNGVVALGSEPSLGVSFDDEEETTSATTVPPPASHTTGRKKQQIFARPTAKSNSSSDQDNSSNNNNFSMEELLGNLQKKFVTRTSVHNLF